MIDSRGKEHYGNPRDIVKTIARKGSYIHYWYRTYYMTRAEQEWGTIIGSHVDRMGVRWIMVMSEGTEHKRKISAWDIIKVCGHSKAIRRRHDPTWVEVEFKKGD